MVIHEAAENYLEAIYMLLQRKGSCRSVDVSRELGFAKPTISVMMKNLREHGYVVMDENGYISLTESGRDVATQMYQRHEAIAAILIRLGVSEEVAYQDSCKIEHDLSDESFHAIVAYMQKQGILE